MIEDAKGKRSEVEREALAFELETSSHPFQ